MHGWCVAWGDGRVEMNAHTKTNTATSQTTDLAFALDAELTKFNMANKIMTQLFDGAERKALAQMKHLRTDAAKEFHDAVDALQWQFDQIRALEAKLRQMCDDAFEARRAA